MHELKCIPGYTANSIGCLAKHPGWRKARAYAEPAETGWLLAGMAGQKKSLDSLYDILYRH